jgi:uncharacterized membrane protein
VEILNTVLKQVVNYATFFFEYVGVIVIIFAGVNGAINLVKKHPFTRLNLAKGMALGLEFKLGSEILRTVVVREISEIFIVAGIIILRAALALLIHWEIKNAEAHEGLNQESEL